jgi:hypothetical protein
MDAGKIERIETNVERAASATFAGAIGYAVYGLAAGGLAQPQRGICAAGAAMVAYVLCSGVLGAVTPRKPKFAVPIFDVRHLEAGEPLLTKADQLTNDELPLSESDQRLEEELLLTDADRLEPCSTHADPLILDDILAEIGPDARVVRLFDRRAMPTPGQLKSRIDCHLDQGSPKSGASDASQALSDALAELRRSLR